MTLLRMSKGIAITYKSSRPMSSRPTSTTQVPVRLVLFDVFDTLCTPRDAIHLQYHEEAIRSGISSDDISPETVRSAFKPTFKEINAKHHLYGKHSTPPLTPGEWWTELIKRCIVNAGADEPSVEAAMPTLGPSLLSRFESDKGYKNFPETLACLDQLRELGVKTSLVSNADPRILSTLASLGILTRLSYPPTISWDVEAAKPDARIFEAACKSCGEELGEGVLMIGDELKADYQGAAGAGLEGRLIRRQGEWSDGAMRTAEEELNGVNVIHSLDEVVQEVLLRNR